MVFNRPLNTKKRKHPTTTTTTTIYNLSERVPAQPLRITLIRRSPLEMTRTFSIEYTYYVHVIIIITVGRLSCCYYYYYILGHVRPVRYRSRDESARDNWLIVEVAHDLRSRRPDRYLTTCRRSIVFTGGFHNDIRAERTDLLHTCIFNHICIIYHHYFTR